MIDTIIAGKMSDLFAEKESSLKKIADIDKELMAKAREINLQGATCFFPGVQAFTVWEKGDLNIALLINKNRLGGCAVLLWGVQFECNYAHIAMDINGFEAQFMVFDGQPGSHDFAMLNGNGPTEREELYANIEDVCRKEKINLVYCKNAGMLRDSGFIRKTLSLRDIPGFYMLIARPDGSLIPEFSFINPQKSSAFWKNL